MTRTPAKSTKKEATKKPSAANTSAAGLMYLFGVMHAMTGAGCETDEMPGSSGEFGHEPTNPIPTRTTFGAHRYLGRLKLPDGSRVFHKRLGSKVVGRFPNPIDVYAITTLDGEGVAKLYVSAYEKRNSLKTPRGFAEFTLKSTESRT